MKESTRRHGRSLPVLALLTALVLSGCGIGVEAAPTTLPPGLSAELVVPEPSTSPTAGTRFPVFLVCGSTGRLVELPHYFNRAPNPKTALDELNEGPTEEEIINEGITTELATQGPQVSFVSTTNGIATVELDTQFGPPNLIGARLAQAFAQIAYTLTSPSAPYELHAVQFVFGGVHRDAYLPNGRLASVVSYKDYDVSPLGPPLRNPAACAGST